LIEEINQWLNESSITAYRQQVMLFILSYSFEKKSQYINPIKARLHYMKGLILERGYGNITSNFNQALDNYEGSAKLDYKPASLRLGEINPKQRSLDDAKHISAYYLKVESKPTAEIEQAFLDGITEERLFTNLLFKYYFHKILSMIAQLDDSDYGRECAMRATKIADYLFEMHDIVEENDKALLYYVYGKMLLDGQSYFIEKLKYSRSHYFTIAAQLGCDSVELSDDIFGQTEHQNDEEPTKIIRDQLFIDYMEKYKHAKSMIESEKKNNLKSSGLAKFSSLFGNKEKEQMIEYAEQTGNYYAVSLVIT